MNKKYLRLSPILITALVGFFSQVSSAQSTGQPWSGILDPSRAIPWTNVGVGGIPSRTVCTTIAASACGNGSSDCTSTIQNALNACPVEQAVLLGSGTFRINSSVVIPSSVSLRGSGASQTVLNAMGSAAAPVQLGTGGPTSSNASASASITAGATAGSTSIVVSTAAGISVGTYLLITELNDPSYVTIAGGEGNCTWCDAFWAGARARGQIVEVTSVSGTTIGITPGLYSAYARTPLATVFSASARRAGVENLQVYANNTGYTADLMLSACAYCWVRGVEANYTDGDFLQVHWGYRDEIRDSYFSNAYNHTPGTTDSDVFIVDKTSATLVENNIIERAHAAVMINWGAAGNVIAYNYTEGEFDSGSPNYVMGGIGFHGAHPQFNLMEGNVTKGIQPDQIWGSSSHGTAFRNWVTGTTTACNPLSARATVTCSPTGQQGQAGVNGWSTFQGSRGFAIDNLAAYYNLVGNVSGSAQQNGLSAYGNQTSHVAILQFPATRSYDSTNYNMTFGYGESSDDGSGTGCAGSTAPPCHSTAAFSTALLYNEFTYASGATNCFSNGTPASCTSALPASFYLTSKPTWFGSLAFPAIGPDVVGGLAAAAGHANMIPAQACYLNVIGGTDGGAASPRAFDANTCYGASSGQGGTSQPPSAPSNVHITP